MSNYRALTFIRSRVLQNEIRGLAKQSKFKIFVVTFFGLLFMAIIAYFFYRGFSFFSRNVPSSFQELVLDYLFSTFYFALLAMLFFSSLIIAFSVFFHNKEARFLMTTPLRPENIFIYKFLETFLFAAWAVIFLGVPLGCSFGIQQGVAWSFYPCLVLAFIPYIMIPCAIGSLTCFITILYISRFRRLIGFLFLVMMAIAIALLTYSIISLRREIPAYTTTWLFGLLDYLNFTKAKLLPSLWMAKAFLAASRQEYGEFFFQFSLLLSTALFTLVVCYWLATFRYFKAWDKAYSQIHKKAVWKLTWVRSLLKMFFFLPSKALLFLEKDIKVLVRDPIQWTQFAILLGLLLLYILNLRTLKYDQQSIFWRQIIANLNLMAASLTICTFASRFIFPMLSLEGKRFWTLGVMPIKRSSVLMAKFTFSLTVLTFMSLFLVILSCYMLRLPWQIILLHSITSQGIVFGVGGMAVGFGAIYPNFNEDSPSKIVSGFGGTLNLVLSLFFVLVVVFLQMVPTHLILKDNSFPLMSYATLLLIFVVVFIATTLPLYIGIKKFDKLEM